MTGIKATRRPWDEMREKFSSKCRKRFLYYVASGPSILIERLKSTLPTPMSPTCPFTHVWTTRPAPSLPLVAPSMTSPGPSRWGPLGPRRLGAGNGGSYGNLGWVRSPIRTSHLSTILPSLSRRCRPPCPSPSLLRVTWGGQGGPQWRAVA